MENIIIMAIIGIMGMHFLVMVLVLEFPQNRRQHFSGTIQGLILSITSFNIIAQVLLSSILYDLESPTTYPMIFLIVVSLIFVLVTIKKTFSKKEPTIDLTITAKVIESNDRLEPIHIITTRENFGIKMDDCGPHAYDVLNDYSFRQFLGTAIILRLNTKLLHLNAKEVEIRQYPNQTIEIFITYKKEEKEEEK